MKNLPNRIRRLLPLSLLFILLLLLCACQNSHDGADLTKAPPSKETSSAASPLETSTAAFSEEEAVELAGRMADAMHDGDFAALTALFNEQMNRALTEESLKNAWDSTINPLGAYQGRLSSTPVSQKGICTVSILERYENGGLSIQISFESASQIQGLFLTYADLSGFPDEADTVPAVPEGVREEAILVSGHPDFPLSGVLTFPENAERPPVVVLIQGSGSSDRNETIYENKPFQDIAWGLAQSGIASIRYDKRYYTYPQAAASSVTIEAEVLEDLEAALTLAENDPRLDSERVFVLGHSLGGMLTPDIAAAHPELAGIISMAGSLRPLWEISWDQNQEAAKAARPALSDEENRLLDEQLAQVKADVETLRSLADEGSLAGLTPLPDSLNENSQLLGIPLSYWSSLERHSAMAAVGRIHLPVLILQGDADFQVNPDIDYPLWQEALAGRDNAVFHLYPGLNHLMMPTRGQRDLSEYAVRQTVSEQVIQDIAAFIMR